MSDVLDRLETALADTYAIDREIGRGSRSSSATLTRRSGTIATWRRPGCMPTMSSSRWSARPSRQASASAAEEAGRLEAPVQERG